MSANTTNTTPLLWSDELYGTGVPEIDAQHRQLFEQINTLLQLSVLGNNTYEIARLLAFLDRYVVTHFTCEEALMERHRCSGCAANRIAHRKFIEDFAALRDAFKRQGLKPSFLVEAQRLLVAWLSNHIIKIDRTLREATVTTPPTPQAHS